MANRLVPFIQDEKKWTEHYMAQARKQIAATRVPQLKEFVQPEIVQPKLISPIAKLLAQAESELKREQNERPVFTPIVARLEFDKSENTTGSTEDTKVNIEDEDEVRHSKRKKTCGCTQMRRKKEKKLQKNSKRKKTYGYTQQKGKKRSSLHIRDIFNE